MKYDFDRVIERRGTNSNKWDGVEIVFGDKDVLPLWVADMDFQVAEPISRAIKERAAHAVYGYTPSCHSYVEAVVERMQRKFNWKIQPEWVVFTPGVVPALNAAVKAFSRPGDDVVLQGPVYFPFWQTIKNCGCSVMDNQLKFTNGRYLMDYEDLEKKFGPRDLVMSPVPCRTKMIIFCNPHNPVGRVWTKEEITRMGEIVIRHGGIVISDEIHCELLFKGSKHIPFATISKEFEQNCIVCMAPSKTFNLAGLEASSIIIPNPKLRTEFNNVRAGIQPRPNAFGFIALEAAYRDGDEWLEQLLDYLQGNLEFLVEYFEKRIPRIKVIRPEGTYLVWLDCRELGMDALTLKNFMNRKAKVGLDHGYLFGPSGAGFERLNIACPRTTLEDGLRRIERAVNSL